MSQNYKNLIITAQTLQKIAPHPESEFWAGYLAGLRRSSIKINLSTEQDDDLTSISVSESDDLSTKLRAIGYRSALDSINMSAAIKKLSTYISASNAGKVKSAKKSKSSAENGRKGGRPKKITST